MSEYLFEFKYEVDPATAGRIERFIGHYGMKPDSNAGLSGSYYVCSLYFDTIIHSDYYDKRGGFLNRIKVRARVYDPEFTLEKGELWLETKERKDAVIKKTKAFFSPRDWMTFSKYGAAAFVRNNERAKHSQPVYRLFTESRVPSVFVRYVRKPYLGMFDGDRIRVTFDYDTEASRVFHRGSGGLVKGGGLWYPCRWIPFGQRRVIMEVKFKESLPAWFGELVRYFELERQSISKYALGFDAIRGYQTPY